MKNINPMIRQEPRVERQPQQAILRPRENHQLPDCLGLLRFRLPNFDGPLALTEIDAAIVRDRELDRFEKVCRKSYFPEMRRIRTADSSIACAQSACYQQQRQKEGGRN